MAHEISRGAATAAEYLDGLRKILAAKAAPAVPPKLLAKARALKKPKVAPQALLEKLTGRARSGSGYVAGD